MEHLLASKYGASYCEALKVRGQPGMAKLQRQHCSSPQLAAQIDLKPGNDGELFKWLCCSLMFSSGLSEKLTTRVRPWSLSQHLSTASEQRGTCQQGVVLTLRRSKGQWACRRPAGRSWSLAT